jgi:Zinc-binding dehydrogenase
MIGVDPHKASHTAVAIDASERQLGRLRVRASATQASKLVKWADRTWAGGQPKRHCRTSALPSGMVCRPLLCLRRWLAFGGRRLGFGPGRSPRQDAQGGPPLPPAPDQHRSAAVVRRGGTLVSIVSPPKIPHPGGHAVFFVVEPNRPQLAQLARLAQQGQLTPLVGTVRPLAETRDAFVNKSRAPGKTSSRYELVRPADAPGKQTVPAR